MKRFEVSYATRAVVINPNAPPVRVGSFVRLTQVVIASNEAAAKAVCRSMLLRFGIAHVDFEILDAIEVDSV